jgi:hypothetical protein
MNPVVTGSGIEIEGAVVSCKWQQGGHYYAPDVLKILILDDRNFKVWGSCPNAICDSVDKGTRLKLTANVEASKDDETFGFFKRPRKAELQAAD